ncbi:hypothetical protein SAMD00079811_73980 [Scytonema sp. HK-05]|uniref:hypothetical protein n=1 Tax=Scytonema sp. HK-05 TaxID=1137095 RepID=UPI0009363CBA|nr:hypothetical protein [Scytonema sp. HK-05]OKH53320.1 hypothetical protein NIES2130_30665 [Scytonema sp. HK-05]BAY49769.1 hypothetical protein SAMD00079811_73980 [Scytonema sp. HK-05]
MIDASMVLEILAFFGKGIANAGLKDIYEKWKKLIKAKISSTTVAKTVEPEKLLEEYEQNPDIWKEPMKAALDEAQIGKDEEIIKGALHLLGLTKPTQNNGTFQSFNNNGSGTQNNIGNKFINNHTVYNQASEFFDEVDERSGFRIRTTYQRDHMTGARIIVGKELA